MSPLMLHRTIIIFTLVTGIAHSLAKDKPNTFWSKRAEDPSFTNPTEEEGITRSFYTPREATRNLSSMIITHFLQSSEHLKFRETILE